MPSQDDQYAYYTGSAKPDDTKPKQQQQPTKPANNTTPLMDSTAQYGVGIPDGQGGYVYYGTPEYEAHKAKTQAASQERLASAKAQRDAEGWGEDAAGRYVDPYGWQMGSPYPQHVYKEAYERGVILPSQPGGYVNFGTIAGQSPLAGTGDNAYGLNDIATGFGSSGNGYAVFPREGARPFEYKPPSSGPVTAGERAANRVEPPSDGAGNPNGQPGTQPTGNQPTGNQPTGNQPTGNQPTNQPTDQSNYVPGTFNSGPAYTPGTFNPQSNYYNPTSSSSSSSTTERDSLYPLQPMGFSGDRGNYSISAPGVNVSTRQVSDDELASQRLENLLDPNSAMAKRARQEGIDYAASRGLMNSSIAGGNAFGAWIDRVQPYALDEAAAYQRTASENMGARNQGALADASNRLQALMQSAQLNADADAQIRQFGMDQATDYNRALLNVESREDTQQYGTDERRDTQAWQSGENALNRDFQTFDRQDSQAWQSGENSLDRDFQTFDRQDTQAWQTGERLGTQGWQTGERLGQQDWQTGERLGTQDWQTGERVDTQGWQSGENSKNRAFESTENAAQRGWQSGENAADRTFQGSENAANRGWQTNERLGNQDWQSGENAANRQFEWDQNAANRDWQAAQNNADRSLNLYDIQVRDALNRENIAAQDRALYWQAYTATQNGLYATRSQAAASILGNWNLTPDQQAQAWQNFLAVDASLAPQLPNPPPSMGGGQSGTQPPGGDDQSVSNVPNYDTPGLTG